MKLGYDFDSTILDNQNKLAIKELCRLPLTKKLKLQYRATRDGFTAQNFHTKCDTAANTLTIIKSEHGNIFGAFTEKAWNSSGQYYADPKSFIFSLVNKENKSFKVNCTNGVGAIYCSSSYGPSFGNSTTGHDILIYSDSNTNKGSLCNFSSSYNHADYPKYTEKAKTILAGSYHFQTLEIEVFVCTS